MCICIQRHNFLKEWTILNNPVYFVQMLPKLHIYFHKNMTFMWKWVLLQINEIGLNSKFRYFFVWASYTPPFLSLIIKSINNRVCACRNQGTSGGATASTPVLVRPSSSSSSNNDNNNNNNDNNSRCIQTSNNLRPMAHIMYVMFTLSFR